MSVMLVGARPTRGSLLGIAAEAPPPDTEPPSGDLPSAGGPLLRPNEARVSRTDPEATLVNRPDFGRHLA